MEHYVLDFIPPITGIQLNYNTIRLGVAWSKKLQKDDKVFIMDNKAKKIIGMAMVNEIFVGPLEEICRLHGHWNHTQLPEIDWTKPNSSLPQPVASSESAEAMMRTIQKIYGPHIAVPTKKATAIYLSRIG